MIKDKEEFDILNQELLKKIVSWVKEIPLLSTSFVLSIKSIILTTFITIYLAFIKLVAIFMILYVLIYQNNSNYITLLIAMYLYLTET